ncbi:hypothetical protein WG68_04445 [Arsukibacterium ikkense]|uniref:Uncharacterized protein n=1 Tax=Arsukibacterium ikkense TaxID=336831 RepID=A0A0M2V7G0_9GAMM|nr:hypothetical protein [Arsukibacterium ikkense]KKO46561.1 hypothetical protein WG68_04445 [Arsukibacterium ikkense]
MSLSRRLIETLVKEEVCNNNDKYGDLNVDKIIELSNQVFLMQVTLIESKSVKKSVQDKIEHFNALMFDS